jgi:hypothetical protein
MESNADQRYAIYHIIVTFVRHYTTV